MANFTNLAKMIATKFNEGRGSERHVIVILEAVYLLGQKYALEQAAQIAENAAPVCQDMEYAPLQEFSTDIAAKIRKISQ
jgi:hypothetical protein